jgi:hypothetical protein
MANWVAIAAGYNVFVGIAANANGYKVCVYDGNEAIIYTNTIPHYSFQDIESDGSIFVAVAYGDKFIVSYDDGVAWSEITVPISKNWYRIRYFDNKWTAIAWDGDSQCIIESEDLQEWSISNNTQAIQSYMSCLCGNNNGLAIIMSNNNDTSTKPRSLSTFNQDNIQQLENGVPLTISCVDENIFSIKASVPSTFTQVTLDLYDMTGDSGDWYIYIGNGYIPSWWFYDAGNETGGSEPKQIIVSNVGDSIFGISIEAYGSGTLQGKIKVNFS